MATKQAKLKSTVNRILVAGSTVGLTANDFDLYVDGIISTAIRGGETFSGVSGTAPIFATATTTAITLYVSKHTRSTSQADDENSLHWNTAEDDLGNVLQLRLSGTLTHPTEGAFSIAENLYYCPALYPPNISISRMDAVLKNASTCYSGVFGNAQINEFSPSKPDKLTPYKASELIGYSPRYAPVILKYLYDAYHIDEGGTSVAFDVDYIANNVNSSSGISNVKLTATRQQDSVVTVFQVSTPSLKAEGTISCTLQAGNYTVVASFVLNGVPYTLSTTGVTVYAAVANITSLIVSSYSAITGSMSLTATATAGKSYSIYCTTYWEDPFAYPITTYELRSFVSDWTMQAGSNSKTVTIPQTKPAEIAGNSSYVLRRIYIELRTVHGNLAKTVLHTV